MAKTAKAPSNLLIPSPKALEKALRDSADRARRMADAFGLKVPRVGPKKGNGMNISPKSVRFEDDTLWVALSDGRTIAAPLTWFPRLLQAAPEERAKVELSKGGLHWDALDEDISVAGLLAGQRDFSKSPN
jgi:hypothetical protein